MRCITAVDINRCKIKEPAQWQALYQPYEGCIILQQTGVLLQNRYQL